MNKLVISRAEGDIWNKWANKLRDKETIKAISVIANEHFAAEEIALINKIAQNIHHFISIEWTEDEQAEYMERIESEPVNLEHIFEMFSKIRL